MTRISWQEYFLEVMDASAKRASCDRGKSACIIVRDNRILATGYVGAPSGIPSCDEVGHRLVKRCEIPIDDWEDSIYKNVLDNNESEFVNARKFTTHCIRTVHAEENAIINCARAGISTLGSTLYVTMTPCFPCAMKIIQAGIVKVVARNKYQKDTDSRAILKRARVELVVLEEKEIY